MLEFGTCDFELPSDSAIRISDLEDAMKLDDVTKLLKTMQSVAAPAEARADHLIYNITENGLDMRPAVIQLLKEADEGRLLKAKAAEEERAPLSPETFIGQCALLGQTFAVVTTGPSDIYLPCKKDDVKD